MRIDNNELVIFDGAMGTYYMNLYHEVGSQCEKANVNAPQNILAIHKAYIAAGCNAIKTNTFGANTVNLSCDTKTLQKVICEGYKLAQEAAKAANECVRVFADIGPVPIIEKENALVAYKEIVDEFINLGAKNFLFETFSSEECLPEIAKYIKAAVSDAYIIVSFAISPEGYTRMGKSGKNLINKISTISEIDAVGFNCFSGPKHLLAYMQNTSFNQKDIAIMPNMGYPTVINNRTFFNQDSHYFASQMVEIVKQGAQIIGGCCGTTPEIMAEVVKEVKTVVRKGSIIRQESLVSNTIKAAYEASHQEAVSSQEEVRSQEESKDTSQLIDKMNKGKKIIAVELDPPLDTEITAFMEGAKKLQLAGVDAVTIADCPIARARVDSSLLACKLKRELGITPIPHMTCRDRNINATKALLLGLNIEGVRDVLVVTGDPIPTAQRDEIKAMFSFNSSVLASYIRELNETNFKAPFNICGALNINAHNFESELKKAQRKIEHGISVFLTQPVLTREAVRNLKQAHETLNAKILGGIMPVVSYRNACFMNNEISGINVADEIIELYREADKETSAQLAVTISTKIAGEIADYVDGYYLITPFKRVELMTQIMENIKALND